MNNYGTTINAKRVYTPSDFNSMTKDIETKVEKPGYVYPVMIPSNAELSTNPTCSIIPDMKQVGNDTVIDIDLDGLKMKATIATYEFINPDTGEKCRIELPKIEKCTAQKMYKVGKDFFRVVEPLRKYIVLQSMVHKDVQALGIINTGLSLADKLSGKPGLPVTVEQHIRLELYPNSDRTRTINQFIDDYMKDRTKTELKEKYLSALINEMMAACDSIYNALKDKEFIQNAVPLKSTGINPVVLKEPNTPITEISDYKEKKENFKSLFGAITVK